MTEAKPFPMNVWYAASWDYELKQALTARTICGKDLVLYRRRDGRPARSRMPAGTACCRCRSGI